jgi:DNA-binding winged helix-turn-helix (wHTH) protein
LVDAERRSEALDEASRLAAATCSPRLREAVLAVRRGDAGGTMLGPLVRRFISRSALPATRKSKITICLREGDAFADGNPLKLTDREMELLALLAFAKGPLHADAVGEHIWPFSDGSQVAASLKTYASRLRRKFGDSEAIVCDRRGYRLGIPHVLRAGLEENMARRVRGWRWLSEKLPFFVVDDGEASAAL